MITLGCRLRYKLWQATPMIAMLNLHYSRFGELERPDYWRRDCIARRIHKRIGETLRVHSILQEGGHRNASTK